MDMLMDTIMDNSMIGMEVGTGMMVIVIVTDQDTGSVKE
tara:strand:- start:8096 stop:8212 length:117 start_codon:yes stop_codon:yes gene_type:complete